MEDSTPNSKNIQEIADLAKVKEELVDHLMTLDNNDSTNVDLDAEVNSENVKISKKSQNASSGGRAVIYKLFEKDGDKATCKICSKVLTVTLGRFVHCTLTLGIQIRNMKMVFNFYGTWRRVTFEKLMMKIYDFFCLAKSFSHPV